MMTARAPPLRVEACVDTLRVDFDSAMTSSLRHAAARQASLAGRDRNIHAHPCHGARSPHPLRTPPPRSGFVQPAARGNPEARRFARRVNAEQQNLLLRGDQDGADGLAVLNHGGWYEATAAGEVDPRLPWRITDALQRPTPEDVVTGTLVLSDGRETTASTREIPAIP